MIKSANTMRPTLEDYRIDLDCYNGPLDLLLFLVKRHEVDLHNLPVAKLTEQYLQHMRLIEQINVDVAGEFLVMAATLLEVKSRMIVPVTDDEEAEDVEDGLSASDPRYELVQQLLAYKKFKDAAMALDDQREQWEQRYPLMPTKLSKADREQASSTDEAENAQPVEIDLEDVNVLDLCEAFSRILESIGSGSATHEVIYDDTPIALHAEDICDRLGRDGTMTLQQMFVGRKTRSEMIGLFLATLELVRQRRIRVIQNIAKDEISLETLPPEDSLETAEGKTSPDWRNPQTGEIEYEWPSEEARKRAERRVKIRATRARNRELAEAQKAADGETAADAAQEIQDTEPFEDADAQDTDVQVDSQVDAKEGLDLEGGLDLDDELDIDEDLETDG